MAFPGYPLSGGKTNLTPQSSDHPTHHNALAAAVNDLQGQMDSPVPGSKLIDGTITTAKLADKAVTGPKMLPAVCQVRRSTDMSISNGTWTSVTFDIEDLDPLGWHSTASLTDRITPTIPGWYQTSCYALWQPDTDIVRLISVIHRNGVQFFIDDKPYAVPPGIGVPNLFTTPLISCNGTTDYINLAVYQNNSNAGALTVFVKLLVQLVVPT